MTKEELEKLQDKLGEALAAVLRDAGIVDGQAPPIVIVVGTETSDAGYTFAKSTNMASWNEAMGLISELVRTEGGLVLPPSSMNHAALLPLDGPLGAMLMERLEIRKRKPAGQA